MILRQVVVFFVLTLVVACTKDEKVVSSSTTLENSKVTSNAREKIDKEVAQIMSFHDKMMNRYIDDIFDDSRPFSDDLIYEIIKEVDAEAKKHSFGFDYIGAQENIIKVIDLSIQSNDGLLKFKELSPDGRYNFELIQLTIDDVISHFEKFIANSKTLEDFNKLSKKYVKHRLKKLQSNDDYFVAKLYVEQYLSSFNTWGEIFDADINEYSENHNEPFYKEQKKNKNSGSWWDRMKEAAKDFYNDAKPILKSDAEGAAAGAVLGSVGGPASSASGAVAGGCASSIGKCIGKLLN